MVKKKKEEESNGFRKKTFFISEINKKKNIYGIYLNPVLIINL